MLSCHHVGTHSGHFPHAYFSMHIILLDLGQTRINTVNNYNITLVLIMLGIINMAAMKKATVLIVVPMTFSS